MAKMYISWHGPINSPVPINGTLIKSEELTLSTSNAQSAVAPAGAVYASVWADVACYSMAGDTPDASAGSNRVARPAGVVYEHRHIQAGTTKIAGVSIA